MLPSAGDAAYWNDMSIYIIIWDTVDFNDLCCFFLTRNYIYVIFLDINEQDIVKLLDELTGEIL